MDDDAVEEQEAQEQAEEAQEVRCDGCGEVG